MDDGRLRVVHVGDLPVRQQQQDVVRLVKSNKFKQLRMNELMNECLTDQKKKKNYERMNELMFKTCLIKNIIKNYE